MIDSLYELSETLTKVTNRVLEVVTDRTSTGQYFVSHEDVSDIISEEDYLQYLPFIVNELLDREEVLDLDVSDGELDVVCGLAWCKNYELLPDEDFAYGYMDLRPAPSMAHLADIGQKAVMHIMEHGYKTPATGLGIKDEDIAFSRSTDRFPDELLAATKRMTPLSSEPVTVYDYEDLLLRSAEARSVGGQSPVHWCFNVFAQDYAGGEVHKKYPAQMAKLADVMKEPRNSTLDRTGSIIHGCPVVELIFDIGHNWQQGLSDESQCLGNVQAKMAAAQISKILEPYHAHFSTYLTDERENNLLVAMIPADADKESRANFEKDFATLIQQGLPFTSDMSRIKTQYETALNEIHHQMPEICKYRPDLAGFEEEIALEACANLGARIGDIHASLLHAQRNNDAELFASLSFYCDFQHNDECLQNAISRAVDCVSWRNHEWVRLSTSPISKDTVGCESFIIHRGELRSILTEMGYDKNFPLSVFLSGYSPETAQEIKELHTSQKKLPLDKQLGCAKERSQQQDKREGNFKDRSRE